MLGDRVPVALAQLLHQRAQLRCFAFPALLLQRGPNVNAVDQEGLTALAIACKEGSTDIVFQLIAAGAYVNLQDRGGDTNLILACKGGHKPIVEALLKRYADVDTRVSGIMTW